jgi:hypothetical protein
VEFPQPFPPPKKNLPVQLSSREISFMAGSLAKWLFMCRNIEQIFHSRPVTLEKLFAPVKG